MASPYKSPQLLSTSFNCPLCDAFAEQFWFSALVPTGSRQGGTIALEDFLGARCSHCNKTSLWYQSKMIFPEVSNVPLPAEDLPDEIKTDFNEARTIVQKSPRGCAALLRLCVQKLCKVLGETGIDINNDIKNLVKKGLAVEIQQALDYLRVVGNESVHPGEMDLKDNVEVATELFTIINLISDVMITGPKRIKELYSGLPANKLKGIQDRDEKVKA